MYHQQIFLLLVLMSGSLSQYTFDDSHGLGRTFDGIGGLSGGGVGSHFIMTRVMRKPVFLHMRKQMRRSAVRFYLDAAHILMLENLSLGFPTRYADSNQFVCFRS